MTRHKKKETNSIFYFAKRQKARHLETASSFWWKTSRFQPERDLDLKQKKPNYNREDENDQRKDTIIPDLTGAILSMQIFVLHRFLVPGPVLVSGSQLHRSRRGVAVAKNQEDTVCQPSSD